MRSQEIPQFGVLQGVKVFSSGSANAGPWAATLMGELGADVIQIEQVARPDVTRSTPRSWTFDHRNQRIMTLDITSSGGREVFLKLIRWADIWIESSKGGTYQGWGLGDDVIWSHNPKLVIVHVSGFGLTGVKEYVSRPGYDGIAQAYGGLMFWNGEAGAAPMRVKPYIADFLPPIQAAFAAVAALRRAEQTGKGESIDLAQYESMVRVQTFYLADALNGGTVQSRSGNREDGWSVYDVFACADGEPILVLISGIAMWKRAITILGLSGDPDFAVPKAMVHRPSAAAEKADAATKAFCEERTALEVERIFNAAGIACSRIFSPKDMEEDPHYQARKTITSWHDEVTGKTVKGPNIVPHFTVNPTQIWRSGPRYNADTDDILDELGFDSDARQCLYAEGACRSPDSTT